MASHIDITQNHDLGRMEAKHRAEAKTSELAARWGLSIHWEDNVLHFEGLGVRGTVTVRNNNVQLVLDLPDTYDSQAGAIEDKARHALAVGLSSS